LVKVQAIAGGGERYVDDSRNNVFPGPQIIIAAPTGDGLKNKLAQARHSAGDVTCTP